MEGVGAAAGAESLRADEDEAAGTESLRADDEATEAEPPRLEEGGAAEAGASPFRGALRVDFAGRFPPGAGVSSRLVGASDTT